MLSRVEHEMNMNWAEQNPQLFVKSVKEFQQKYANADWKIGIDLSRPFYVTLIATRRFTD